MRCVLEVRTLLGVLGQSCWLCGDNDIHGTAATY